MVMRNSVKEIMPHMSLMFYKLLLVTKWQEIKV